MQSVPYINQELIIPSISPSKLDQMLTTGWRHFGERFFRYNLGYYDGQIRLVLPLRVRLADFRQSRSQRRILSKNSDLQVKIGPIDITPESEELFHRHKFRFDHGIPESIFTFLSDDPANIPCPGLEVTVRKDDRLVAASYFDVAETGVSSIYGIFDPEESSRGLGIFTMICEIDYAIANGKQFYYHGYAYTGESFYDYKKRFNALEVYDWGEERWREFEE